MRMSRDGQHVKDDDAHHHRRRRHRAYTHDENTTARYNNARPDTAAHHVKAFEESN